MLKVTEGQWHRKDPIPRAAGDDSFTSRMARELKIFPYERNIDVVVSTVMDKDRQEALRTKQKASLRLVDTHRDNKLSRPSAKGDALAAVMPLLRRQWRSRGCLLHHALLKRWFQRLEGSARSCMLTTT
jgi:hypothetical protein